MKKEREIMMKVLGYCAPVLLSFGPIFIVLGNPPADSPSLMPAIFGFGGAVSLSFGLLYMLKTIYSIRGEFEEIKKCVTESVAV